MSNAQSVAEIDLFPEVFSRTICHPNSCDKSSFALTATLLEFVHVGRPLLSHYRRHYRSRSSLKDGQFEHVHRREYQFKRLIVSANVVLFS